MANDAARNTPKEIRCWACGTPCKPSFKDGKWWYSMGCAHDLAMAYDNRKWEESLDV